MFSNYSPNIQVNISISRQVYNKYKGLPKMTKLHFFFFQIIFKKNIVHKPRNNEFLTNIIEVKVLGKRGRGRSKKLYFEDIKHCIQIGRYHNMKGAALDRKKWLL